MSDEHPDAFDQMNQGFAKIYQGLKRSNEALKDVNEGFDQALEGLKASIEASSTARIRLNDLHESNDELKRMILDVAADIAELRKRLNGGT